MPVIFVAGFFALWWWIGFVWAAIITVGIAICLVNDKALGVIVSFTLAGAIAWALLS